MHAALRGLSRLALTSKSAAPKPAAVLAIETSIAKLARDVAALKKKLNNAEAQVATYSERMRALPPGSEKDAAIVERTFCIGQAAAAQTALDKEKDRLAEEKRLLDNEQQRQHELAMAAQTTAIATLRPTAAFPKGDAEAEQRWNEFVSLKPKPAKAEQAWMDSITSAKFVPVEDGKLAPPDAVAWHKIELGVPLDQTTFRFMDDRKADKQLTIANDNPDADKELTIDNKNPTANKKPTIDNKNPFKFMHVLQLPQSIPELNEQSETLFIRGDTLELFKVARGLNRGVMIGNPGIGKSWFQWVYLLFALRPEIYSALSGEQQLPPFRYRDAKQWHTTHDPPKVILRAIDGGTTTYVYLLDDRKVFKLGDTTAVASLFDFRSTLLLWEPGKSLTPILYLGLRYMQIFATVSPDTVRYKELVKQAYSSSCFMPCPSPAELLAMGRFLREHNAGEDEALLSDKAIKERIRLFGPFIRYALPSSEITLNEALEARDLAIEMMDISQLVAVKSIESGANSPQTSHFFLKYEVDRNHSEAYLSRSKIMGYSSQATMQLVCERLLELELGTLVTLFERNASGKLEKLDPLLLESLFIKHVTSAVGVKWRRRECKAGSIPEDFVLKLKYAQVGVIPDVRTMETDVLFAEMGDTFPFVDCMWKNDKGELHMVQMSISEKHPKPSTAYKSMREKLNVPEGTKIYIDYVFLPKHFEVANFPLSFFWQDAKTMKEELFRNAALGLEVGVCALRRISETAAFVVSEPLVVRALGTSSSNVRELDFIWVNDVDGNQFGDALAVHLRAQGLDTLRLWDCRFVNETLAVVGVELGRIKTLDISDAYLNDASIKLIALALQSPNNEMKDLALLYNDDMASSIENHLVPALMHPNSVHLRFRTQHPRHEAATKTMQRQLRNRRVVCVVAGAASEEIVLPVEAPARGDVPVGGYGVVVIKQDVLGRFLGLNSQPWRWDAKRPEAQRPWVGGGSSLPRRTSRTPPSSYSPSIGIDTRGSELVGTPL
ncbi:hypothetical protein BASA81_015294 [Batrachochytrium salamandrivorans]|nr:hypothetical protein BASA81_015294 [Batrachochytrium salamandrivorans]